jgi:hypothetical protein
MEDSYQLNWQPGDSSNARLEVGLYPFDGDLVEPVLSPSGPLRSSDGYLLLECSRSGTP